MEGIQYIGEITSVHAGDDISTVGDNISTVEGIQYSGRNLQYSVGIPSVQWGITSVLWRFLSTVEIRFEILQIFKESRNLFQSLFRFEIRSTTPQASIVDHG